MNNDYVKAYCEHFNLKITGAKNKKHVTKNGSLVGMFNLDCKYISLDSRTIKKSDLIHFVLEGMPAHGGNVEQF